MESVQEIATKIINNVEKVIVGKHEEVKLTLIALLCKGHVLIEDVPGVGKTVLAKAIAKSIGCNFKRIQFTPDLLPSDVTGVSIYNQKSGDFEFRPGPVIAHIVLADEINRATPKTQSSLLECMEERQVSVDGVTYFLPQPFIVLATQNPIEYEGTFPLPEAQLDRFMMRICIGYPNAVEEMAIMDGQKHLHPLEEISQVVTVNELADAQEKIKEVYVDDLVKAYIVSMVDTTRHHPDVYLGASPRGSLNLYRAAQAWGALDGRDYAIPDDVKKLAGVILSHRLIISPSSRIKDKNSETIMGEIIQSIPVPGTKVSQSRTSH